jgi:hypothetical protein
MPSTLVAKHAHQESAMRSYVHILAVCIALSICDAVHAQEQLPDPAPATPSATLPPISLNVKDAPLEDVAKALSDATGTEIVTPSAADVVRLHGDPADRYTLHVTGPFWEVFRQLTEQHTICPLVPRRNHYAPDLFLVPDSKDHDPAPLWELNKIVIGGNYWLQMTGITLNNYQVRPYIPLSWIVVADPRLSWHIENAVFPPLVHIIDDRGDEMKYRAPPRVASTHVRPLGSVWPQHANLQVPTNGAKKIVSLQGSFTIYELIENGAGETRQITVPFEIKDIALP